MSSQPRSCHRVEVPRHILTFQWRSETEYIAGNRCRPTSCTEIRLCSLFSRFHQSTDKIDQRQHTFAQISGAGRPVVHLNINVIMIIYTPGTIHIIMPDTLQVSRHITSTRTGNQQITSKLIIQLFQIIIRLSVPVVFKRCGAGISDVFTVGFRFNRTRLKRAA